MTIVGGWIQGTAGSIPTYPAATDRQILAAIQDPGVIRGCIPTGGTPARTVIIGTGQFAIAGTDSANQGLYIGAVTAAETVAIAAAPASGTRIDVVYLRVQDLAAGGPAGNNIVAGVVQGTVGGGVPALPSSSCKICEVTISAGQTAVTNAMIADKRVYAEPRCVPGTLKLWYGPADRVPYGWAILTVAGTPNVLGAYSLYPDLANLLAVSSGNIVVSDVRGRALVAVDPSNSVWDALGDLTGAASVVLAAANLPPHAHTLDHNHGAATVSVTDNGHSHLAASSGAGVGYAYRNTNGGTDDIYNAGSSTNLSWTTAPATTVSVTGLAIAVNVPNFTGASSGNGPGTSTAVSVVQPSAAVHVLIRVL